MVALREKVVEPGYMAPEDYNPPMKYVVALENVNKLWR